MACAMMTTDLQPLAEINTTPLIDVMLVLLIMFIMTIPVASHVVEVALPGDGMELAEIRQENVLSVDAAGTIIWNGKPLDEKRLVATLKASLALTPTPLLKYEPDAQAPYGAAARVLAVIKQTGVETFGFVGTERYRDFSKTESIQ